MIKKPVNFLVVICMLLLFLLPSGVAFADSTESNQHVYDKAELLSTKEYNNLENMCESYSNKNDIDIIILTHNDPNAVDAEIYIENFADSNNFEDGVILLVDMYNRDVCLESYGRVRSLITQGRGDTIIDEITPYLSDGNYSKAFNDYIKSSDKYMNYVPIYLRVWVQLIVALVLGAITVGIMAYNSGGKMTVGGNTYIDPNHSGLIGRRDDYIRTQITRVRKPSQNGGGGGISAGGRAHTTSRGKF